MNGDIDWQAFDAGKVDPRILQAMKAAALVEANAADYVAYLNGVFGDSPDIRETIRQWGAEERQHGEALARWARLADPDFDFEKALARFRTMQAIDTGATASRRGSQAGELIARCVVESGTSSLYAAVRDATEEPVLKQLAGRIAADEFAHYSLFHELTKRQNPLPTRWQRLKVAFGRLFEAGDDELASAYYCANVAEEPGMPAYERKTYSSAYQLRAMGLYQRKHVDRLLSMVAKAAGLKPQNRFMQLVKAAAWSLLGWQKKRLIRSGV